MFQRQQTLPFDVAVAGRVSVIAQMNAVLKRAEPGQAPGGLFDRPVRAPECVMGRGWKERMRNRQVERDVSQMDVAPVDDPGGAAGIADQDVPNVEIAVDERARLRRPGRGWL